MPRSRPPYPPEVRQEMVKLGRSGRYPEGTGREYQPSSQTIRNWVAQADRDEGRRDDGLTSADREEQRRLRRDNRRLCEALSVTSGAATQTGTKPSW